MTMMMRTTRRRLSGTGPIRATIVGTPTLLLALAGCGLSGGAITVVGANPQSGGSVTVSAANDGTHGITAQGATSTRVAGSVGTQAPGDSAGSSSASGDAGNSTAAPGSGVGPSSGPGSANGPGSGNSGSSSGSGQNPANGSGGNAGGDGGGGNNNGGTSGTTPTYPAGNAPGNNEARCSAADLRFTVTLGASAPLRSGDQRTRRQQLTLVFTNISSGPCYLRGYPSVDFLRSLTNGPLSEPDTFLGAAPGSGKLTAPRVDLAPGGTATSSAAFVGNGPRNPHGSRCDSAVAVRAFPPDSTVPLAAGVRDARGVPVQQFYVCGHGVLVSVLRS